MGEPMGIGVLGDPKLIIKRKFRFTCHFENVRGGKTIPEHFVKIAARPQIEIDETELNFRNGVTWIPGKGRWQPITITYVDAAHAEMVGLYSWLATVYDFTEPVNLHQGEKPDWNMNCIISMWDGCGVKIEEWLLKNCFPQSVNFGDLDYAVSDECTIDLTLRYSDVIYTAQEPCTLPPSAICTGCGSSGGYGGGGGGGGGLGGGLGGIGNNAGSGGSGSGGGSIG